MVINSLFVLLCIGFVFGQAGRIMLGNNIAISLLDVGVFLYVCCSLPDILKNREKLRLLPGFAGLVLFISICSLSFLFAIFRYSPLQLLVGFAYLFRYVIYALVYPQIFFLPKSGKRWITHLLYTSGIAQLIFGFVQYEFYNNLQNLFYLGWDNHVYRLFSTFFDPNFAGAFYTLFFLFVFAQAIKQAKEIKGSMTRRQLTLFFLQVLLLLITLTAIFFTFSRSALIMLVFSAFVFFLLMQKKKFIFVLCLVLILLYFFVSPNRGIVNTDLLRVATAESRLGSVETALKILQRNPLLGVGFDTYRYALLQYGFRTQKNIDISHADASTDNSFLFVGATTGIIGFAGYLFLLFSLLRYCYREYLRKKTIYYALAFSSLTGVIVDSFFNNSLFYPAFLFWVWSILGIMDYM